jgi:serine/threonine protein kinase
MSDTLFGAWDKIIQDNHTAWCLAKIFRLVGPIDIPENPEYKDDFEMAAALEGSGYMHSKTGEPTPYITVGSVREELQKLSREICSDACIDFIEHLLIIDPAKRPTAEEALRHPFVSSITLDGVDSTGR